MAAGQRDRRVKRSPASLPDALGRETIRRIRAALRHGHRPDLAASLQIAVKRRYVFIADASGWPLCRLRYTGSPDNWGLEMFEYSTETYDTSGEFMVARGSVETCVDAVIRGYHL